MATVVPVVGVVDVVAGELVVVAREDEVVEEKVVVVEPDPPG